MSFSSSSLASSLAQPSLALALDKHQLLESFQKIEPRSILLAFLGRIRPRPGWEGAMVYIGTKDGSPDDPICIGVSGPEAEVIQDQLKGVVGQFQITLHELTVETCCWQEALAQVAFGRWAAPAPAGRAREGAG